jgi:hypothetical protein
MLILIFGIDANGMVLKFIMKSETTASFLLLLKKDSTYCAVLFYSNILL